MKGTEFIGNQEEQMLINYKGHNYLVDGEAYSVNDGKYYVCFRQDGTEEIARLIPSDSKEVRIIG